jgi:hypothetical protein
MYVDSWVRTPPNREFGCCDLRVCVAACPCSSRAASATETAQRAACVDVRLTLTGGESARNGTTKTCPLRAPVQGIEPDSKHITTKDTGYSHDTSRGRIVVLAESIMPTPPRSTQERLLGHPRSIALSHRTTVARYSTVCTCKALSAAGWLGRCDCVALCVWDLFFGVRAPMPSCGHGRALRRLAQRGRHHQHLSSMLSVLSVGAAALRPALLHTSRASIGVPRAHIACMSTYATFKTSKGDNA